MPSAGQGVTQPHADQHRNVDPETAQEAVDQQNGGQHRGGDAEIVHRAELAGGAATTGPVHRYRKQRQADGGDHGAGHQWREEAHDAADEGGDEQAEGAGGDGRAEDAGHADPWHAGHDHHAAHRGETGAHHHRHANAHRPDAQRLHQRGDAGDQQVGIDQKGDFIA